jgi:carbonic anhydrase
MHVVKLLLPVLSIFSLSLAVLPPSSLADEPHHDDAAEAVSPADALGNLMRGNERFSGGKSQAQATLLAKKDANTTGQKPFAIIVCCSDSRVPPEAVFDQSIGDLFVVRTAGHVVDDVALGSIEYAVDHLGCSFILVLGHERCGAVSAVCAGGKAHGHIEALLKEIQPAYDFVKNKSGDPVENTLRANVTWVVTKLSTSSPILSPRVKTGKLKVQGARYDLDTGKVELID